ncbi:MAG TPA: GTPase ObgE [Candidatus Saccharimonadia bacterium]|nr:GTPase ObgE [Candidatus Saccharimonadia bacterium]
MSFVDKVSVTVAAGAGGDGKLSFRREKFITKGGPDGGDGGNGGDIVLLASSNQNTLAAFRYKKELRADSGQAGGPRRKHGRSAKNLLVAVPVGTMAIESDGTVVADLVEDGQQAVVAKGGHGGFGNAHFVSSRRQAPNFAEKGEPGEEHELSLELKMIADVGLVGLPNAGKSTLLSKLSNARPEIADYPFTTLTPNLGVVDVDKDTSILFADIPGLIEGAAEGKGLGHDFLRHIERTAVILHMVDAYNEDVAHAYQTVRAELEAYQPELIKRPEIIALNKVEGLDNEIVDDLVAQLKRVSHDDAAVFAISAQAGDGLPQLKFAVKDVVQAVRAQPADEAKENEIPVLTLTDSSDQWNVSKDGDVFVVTGQKIEKFARRTDFGNEQAVQRLRDIMRRAGILHELRRQGIEPGQAIRIAQNGGQTFSY